MEFRLRPWVSWSFLQNKNPELLSKFHELIYIYLFIYYIYIYIYIYICVLQPNGQHCHTRRSLSETSRQIHLPRK